MKKALLLSACVTLLSSCNQSKIDTPKHQVENQSPIRIIYTIRKNSALELHVLSQSSDKILHSSSGPYMSLFSNKDLSIVLEGYPASQKILTMNYEGSDQKIGNAPWLSDWLEERKFLGPFIKIDESNIIYSLPPDSGDESGLHIENVKTKEKTNIDLTKFGLRNLESIVPIGISSDEKWIYLQVRQWEGSNYEKLWKMSTDGQTFVSLIKADDQIGTLTTLPKQDIAVVVKNNFDRSVGYDGQFIPPSTLILYDLAKGTSTDLFYTDERLIHSVYISPDGSKIFYMESSMGKKEKNTDGTSSYPILDSTLYVMNLSTQEKHLLGKYWIEGMSQDGNILFVADEGPHQESRHMFFDIRTSKTNFVFEHKQFLEILRCANEAWDCLY